MENKDNLSILIESLLKMIKEYAVMETNDKKYVIYLLKESESTVCGKTYEIIINDTKWTSFDEII